MARSERPAKEIAAGVRRHLSPEASTVRGVHAPTGPVPPTVEPVREARTVASGAGDTDIPTLHEAGVAATSPHGAFLLALASGAREAPTAGPAAVRPLVRAVAGHRSVRFRTGATVRRALRRAGVRAATVGSVIHLPDAPDRTPVEVLSHELVHAARPSPRPRFFADSHHSAEEDLARHVGETMRDMAGPVSMAATSVLAAGASTSIRRAVEPPRPAPEGSLRHGTAGLPVGSAAGLSRPVLPRPAPRAPTSAGSPATIRRELSPAVVAAATNTDRGATPMGGFDHTVQRLASEVTSSEVVGGAPAAAVTTPAPVGPVELDAEVMDRIVDELAERVLRELERRGSHYGWDAL